MIEVNRVLSVVGASRIERYAGGFRDSSAIAGSDR